MAAGENTQLSPAQLNDDLLTASVLVPMSNPQVADVGVATIDAHAAMEVVGVVCETTDLTTSFTVNVNDSPTAIEFTGATAGVIPASTTKTEYPAVGGGDNLVPKGASLKINVTVAGTTGVLYAEIRVKYQRSPAL